MIATIQILPKLLFYIIKPRSVSKKFFTLKQVSCNDKWWFPNGDGMGCSSFIINSYMLFRFKFYSYIFAYLKASIGD